MHKKALLPKWSRAFYISVGVAGFEPTTSSSRTTRATGLRYTPKSCETVGAASRREFPILSQVGLKKPPTRRSGAQSWGNLSLGRSGRIRTYDLQHPMLARYQATLHPEGIGGTKVEENLEKMQDLANFFDFCENSNGQLARFSHLTI